MEELELQDKPGFFTRISTIFTKPDAEEDELEETGTVRVRTLPNHRYSVTVRRQVHSFQDAVAAADGLKRGDQQILNLTGADNALREKIKDFMCGVNYAEEGTWEELGENIYLLAPRTAMVDVAPATPRMTAARN